MQTIPKLKITKSPNLQTNSVFIFHVKMKMKMKWAYMYSYIIINSIHVYISLGNYILMPRIEKIYQFCMNFVSVDFFLYISSNSTEQFESLSIK